MDQPASFSSLPPELVSQICSDSDLDKESLMALRLTSKVQGIHASATKAFAKRYFADVLLLWNTYSLETFVKISQHPVFGPAVRKVQLSCARFESSTFYSSVEGILWDHPRQEFLREVQLLSERCQHEELDFDHVNALLGRAFGRLAEMNTSFILAVSADEEKSLGRGRVMGAQLGYEGWSTHPYSALDTLLSAADKSGLRVRGIEIDLHLEAETEPQDELFEIYREVMRKWKKLNCLRSVSELTIDVWIDATWSDPFHDFGVVQCLLELAPHLKNLRIRGDVFSHDETAFEPLANVISRLPLEELHLAGLYLDRKLVLDMMEHLGPTLRHLKVSKCDIHGSWRQILLCIRQHALQLDKLQISEARRSWLPKVILYEGVTDVRSGIADMLKAREGKLDLVRTDTESEGE